MLMPRRPSAVYMDVTLHDVDLSVQLWVRVVDCVATDVGMFLCRVQVVTADDAWSRIVDRVND